MTNPVDAAIAQAEQKAEETAAAAPAVIEHTAPTAVVPARPGKPMSLSDLSAGGLNVDEWLKVNEYGLLAGSQDGKFFEKVKVIIDMTQVQIFECIRAGKNPVSYFKTYDGVTCLSGGTWAEAVERAQKIEPGSRTYQGADIPMIAAEDIKVGDDVVIKKGTILGHSTSVTNRQNLKAFTDQVIAENLTGSEVEVEIGFEKRTKDSYKWGVLTFTLLGEAVDPE